MEQERDATGLEQQIDENLRKVYQKTLEEDVPDKLMQLLQRLREQDDDDGS